MDLTALSDQELADLYRKQSQTAAPSLSAMTDEQLVAAHGQASQSAPKKPFGLADTWPAKIAQSIWSGVTLPGDVLAGKAQLPSHEGAIPGSVPFGDPQSSGQRVADLAMLGAPMAPRVASSLAPAVAASGPPTREALQTAATAGYDQARNLGVEIKPSSVSNLSGSIRSGLENEGIHGELAPKTHAILAKLATPPEGSVATISNLETVRRSLGHAAKDFQNPTEQLAASRAIEHLDGYLANLAQPDLLAGDAAGAAKVLTDARGNYAAAKRSERITDASETADLNAAAANSGQNIGNATRQRINSILKSDKLSRGYSPDELAQMEQVVRGTFTGNTARKLGNLLGGGGGLGAAVVGGIGGVATAPMGGWGAAAPLLGVALKGVEKSSVKRQTNALDEMVRSRSPLADALSADTAMALTPTQAAKRAALVRVLLMSQTKQQSQ